MRKKEGARPASGTQPQNYDSQKPLGAARRRFSEGGSTRGAVGGCEGEAGSFLLARVWGAGHGRVLGAAQSVLSWSNVRFLGGVYRGLSRAFPSPNSLAFKPRGRCVFRKSGLSAQVDLRGSIRGLLVILNIHE